MESPQVKLTRKGIALAVLALVCAFCALTAGCSHEEQPTSKDYYTGPMKSIVRVIDGPKAGGPEDDLWVGWETGSY